MFIKRLAASFGALLSAELELQDGLNIITGHNETGKSTWAAFIRAMFYGIDSSKSAKTADKNLFRPWNGAAMEGVMELSAPSGNITIERRSPVASRPMSGARIFDTDTGKDIGLSGADAGEALLGMTRPVFDRTVYIGRNGIFIDSDSDLESRIMSLSSAGDENISATAAETVLNRAKKKLTGLVKGSAAEKNAELRDIREKIRIRAGLAAEESSAAAEAERLTEELTKLRAELDTLRVEHETLRRRGEIERNIRSLDGEMEDIRLKIVTLDAELSRYGEMPVPERLGVLREAAAAVKRRKDGVKETRLALTEAETQARLADGLVEKLPASNGLIPMAIGILLTVVSILFCIIIPAFWVPAAIAAVIFGAAAVIFYNSSRKKTRVRTAALDTLDLAEKELARCHEAFRRANTELEGDMARLREVSKGLFAGIPDEAEIDVLAEQLRQRGILLSGGERLRGRMEEFNRALSELPSPAQMPEKGRDESVCAREITAAEAALREATARREGAAARLSGFEAEEVLCKREENCLSEIAELTLKLAAVELAVIELAAAAGEMERRFAPAINKKASELFCAFTGGRYESVLMSRRDFSPSARGEASLSYREPSDISRGSADQLYLALRLAICLALYGGKTLPPLILDDALITFDDARLANALETLAALGCQVLLFSCHRREAEMMAGQANIVRL